MKLSDIKYNKKNPVVSFRLRKSDYNFLRRKAKENGEMLSVFIAKILKDYLKYLK